MVRITEAHDIIIGSVRYFEYAGLSTDQKPTSGGAITVIENGERVSKEITICTGSLFLEVDTGNAYLFDEIGKTWTKVGGN